ncbi:alpha/beta hydrolase [Hymenobacter sp. PAMC 26628]|uniref:alpha/beta hydrolase n=1 Tax=Hymenobacter sp. PAMC 26628 TaxID=1484118 RepID=UPI0012FF7AFD|nr:alpha/beta hydrolase [Hymenobacter sp. PAMC 26628]
MRCLLNTGLVLFGLANVVVFLHAWRLTHFSASAGPRTKSPEQLSAAAKLGLVLTGVSNPRPVTGAPPAFPYQSVFFESPNGRLAAWYGQPAGPARGTVALFHGYTSEKSHLTTEAAFFRRLGYAVLLVDFAGGGGSAGSRVTVGYREAADVAAAARWLGARPGGPGPLVLYGVSMGAVAILRAEAELGVRPAANVLECPFGSLRQTARNRFAALHVPAWPLADLLVFWGGLQNGFWGPGLSAERYAAQVATPTLLLWGTADARVTRAETDAVFRNLRGPKQRHDFVGAGHEPYWHRYPAAWQAQVSGFLSAE